ncbi:MAG: Asp-tRNA(Asn)/Glu-tRNA(Gln) amidotransferase GatCAB subunit B, partial [Promethearchaeota archaeon]
NNNPKIVEDCRSNARAIEALIGKIMAKTKGQADPEITREILIDLLKKKSII